MKNVKRSVMKRIVIPLVLLMSISLAGCITTQSQMPTKPTKPTLEMQENPDDPKGICLDRDDTYLLLDYIWKLEEGYE